MKVIRYSFLALLVFICLGVAMIGANRHPAISLAFSAPNPKINGPELNGFTIAVQKAPIPLSFGWEKHRRVVVCDGPVHHTSEHLIADYARQVNLYRHKSGSIVMVNGIWMMELKPGPAIRIFNMQEEEDARSREPGWKCGDIGPIAASGFPESVFFKDMEYLGAFSMLSDQTQPIYRLVYSGVRFLPSATHGEELCRYPVRG